MTLLPANPNRFSNDAHNFGGNVITPAHTALCAILNRQHIPYRTWVVVERPGEFTDSGAPKTYEMDVLAWERVDFEADGNQHRISFKVSHHDEIRDAWLVSSGTVDKVVRFENKEILKPMYKDWVMSKIWGAKPH